ncbi:hypothetical protein E3J61_00100 [Candidatus Dependentiae bacterium]|nr:MAG: hypothetical protein E3J61_00100 [Candidatus Dependentiae bacterium]
MKKSYLLSLVCLVTISGSCLAMEEEKALLDRYIEEFKALPEEERVAKIARKDFLEGHVAEDSAIAEAFTRHPEKRVELYRHVQGLKPQIRAYCLHRLDDIYQEFLKTFEQKPTNKRGSITFDYQEGRLETYLLPEPDVALLKKMPPEQEEPFYVLATLIQMDAAVKRSDPSRKPKNPRVSRLRKLIRAKA